jgi:hypothetical protein
MGNPRLPQFPKIGGAESSAAGPAQAHFAWPAPGFFCFKLLDFWEGQKPRFLGANSDGSTITVSLYFEKTLLQM